MSLSTGPEITPPDFAVGSLVRARGREWVVLPQSDEEMLLLRPLGGADDEIAGIVRSLEPVDPASFDLPDPARAGDYRSCRMLRDAVRLGFRSSAGPFRSFARLAVDPRPYQLVPLMMALKLDPVRLLIADDVGIGKTVEASLIARELLDRGEVNRLTVLCPPQLAEQWREELFSKFHIDAKLVLPATAGRLERGCRLGESLFERYPFTIVSLDYVKQDRRRDEFLRACPEFVIVDEAHTCANIGSGGHQRHGLIKALAASSDRHLVLVTATPHSGKEDAFRSLLGCLDPSFAELPEDLSGPGAADQRRLLSAHFVQRRRANVQQYLGEQTPFPDRTDAEYAYTLDPHYKKLFDRVLRYARESVLDPSGSHHHQRVRWWSALALLRSLASSPASAAATLRTRAATAGAETAEEADDIGRRTVLDQDEDGAETPTDVPPGASPDEPGNDTAERRRLLEMAIEADRLKGAHDNKLTKAAEIAAKLVTDGYRPILFCRFIDTAEYVAAALRKAWEKGPLKEVRVESVTGLLPPADRERRIADLAESDRRVLVCTDCLSEGINLQEHFDSVVHYDLSWNPTRHEQREGRVDRYGQPRRQVRLATIYGLDNQIDGIVLKTLMRKHQQIRNALGISVPVPVDLEQLTRAIAEGLLLSRGPDQQLALPFLEADLKPQTDALYREWDAAADREKRSRTLFAQEAIKPEEVARELQEVREAIGSGVELAAFTGAALRSYGAAVTDVDGGGTTRVDLTELPRGLREAMGVGEARTIQARFQLPVSEGEMYLSRSSPFVEGLAAHVMNGALDPALASPARRCGVIRTAAVTERCTLLLIRLRYHLLTRQGDKETQLLAEDCRLAAFAGSPQDPRWLDADAANELLLARPAGNTHPDLVAQTLHRTIAGMDALQPRLNQIAEERGKELLTAHRRVRTAARLRGVQIHVEHQPPVDVLGVYVYLPPISST